MWNTARLQERRVQVGDAVSLPPSSQVEVAVRTERGPLESSAPVRGVTLWAVRYWVLGENEAGPAVALGCTGVPGVFDRVHVVVFCRH
jgi:hypothetical protein